MRPAKNTNQTKAVHVYAWLWEDLESDAGFLLKSMFGTKAVYLDGKLVLCFVAKEEPWHGVLIATERSEHERLWKEFPALEPHPILPKWLYLPDSTEGFETLASRLVSLAKRRDPRLGIIPPQKSRKKK